MWGVKWEKKAQELYLKFQKLDHINLCIAESGLVINSRWPFIGASPDGIVSCGCYETKILEIKCLILIGSKPFLMLFLKINHFVLRK